MRLFNHQPIAADRRVGFYVLEMDGYMAKINCIVHIQTSVSWKWAATILDEVRGSGFAVTSKH
jgi:hypothetical protein